MSAIPVNPEDFGAVVAPTVKIDPAQFGAMANIDEERGAPPGVRESVGASKKPEDKLTTLQSYYPDAKPWGSDNFVYTDHETGNQTLYNPKGLDMGDVRENTRIFFEFLGGAVGGTAATIAGQLGPQALTPEEIITVPLATGAGAAVGGQVYDILSSLFTPHSDTRTFLERTAGMGTDVLVNTVGTRAGELLEQAARKAASAGSKFARASSDEIYKAFNKMGTPPIAGAVSGSPTVQGIEQALLKMPGSADMVNRGLNETLDGMSDYALKLASDTSITEGRELVGSAIKKGAETFVKQFQTKAGKLYDVVDGFIPKNTKVSLTNLGSVLDNMVGKDVSPEIQKTLGTSLINQMKAINTSSKKMVIDNLTMTSVPKGVSYSSLKALRTKVGGMLDGQLIGDTTQGELKRLYGALSSDMEMAARNVGGKAGEAANRAALFWKAGRSRIDNVLQPVVNKKLTHEIYNTAMSGAQHSAQKLRTIKRSIPKEEWDSVVAQQIREMGMAKAGAQNVTGDVFSPATFMTNYSKLAENGADKIIFGGPQYKGLSEALDNLVKTSAALKDTAKMANNSGTAQQMMYMQVLAGGGALGGGYGSQSDDGVMAGIGQGIATAATAMTLPWAAAKLMTSPKFIRWLADGGKTAVTQTGIGAHLARLAAIGANDKDLEPAINEYMRTISPNKEGLSNEQ